MTYERALRLFLLFVGGCVALVLVAFLIGRSAAPAPPPQPPRPREAALIEAKGLPEFAPETNAVPATKAELDLGKQMQPVLELVGDGKQRDKVQQAITALATLISKNPNWADAQFLRATLQVTIGNDHYDEIRADIDRALGLPLNGVYNATEMYALRAQVDVLARMPEQALSDLDKALLAAKGDSREVFNTGGTKAEDTSNPTVLHRKDFDSLVAEFPTDFRVYLYRGLFYLTFAFYDEKLYPRVFKDIERACELNPHSAVAKFYLANAIQHTTFFTKAAASDISDVTGARGGYKEVTYRRALPLYQEAIRLDPTFTLAHAQAAECLYALKQYQDAIPYYNAVLEREPDNASALNDRGLAKTNSGDPYGAVTDFSQAIERKKNRKSNNALDLEHSIGNRAKAYLNAHSYDAAIADFSKLIGLSFARVSLLMPLSQIRAVYPELGDLADRDLLEGLRQKYYPNMDSAGFAKIYAENQKRYEEFVTAGHYVSRGDAYLQSGHFKRAAQDYARANAVSSGATDDRWKVVANDPSTELSVDVQTLDFTQGNLVSVWTKVVARHGNGYQQDNYQFDCRGRRMKTLASMRYDDGGNALWSHPEGEWQAVAPETIGERLFAGMCR
jgi:tetratricopeptide (TPR) repeat protein